MYFIKATSSILSLRSQNKGQKTVYLLIHLRLLFFASLAN